MAYIKRVKRKDGKVSIYIREKKNGNDIKLESLGVLNRDVSISQAKTIEARYNERKRPLTADITLSLLLDEFIPYYQSQVGKTIKQRTFDIVMENKQHFTPLLNISLKSITYIEIEGFKHELQNKLANRSINIILNSLKKALRFGVRKQYLHSLPEITKLQEFLKDTPWITKEQIEKILEEAPCRLRFYVLCMFYTGLRPKEFTCLDWADVDLKNKRIKICSNNPKKKGRVIPIHSRLLVELKDVEYQKGRVSPYPSRHSALSAMKKAAEIIGEKITPSGLRKTFGSLMAAADVNIFTLARLMGHSDIKTTNKYYVGLSADKLKRDIEKI